VSSCISPYCLILLIHCVSFLKSSIVKRGAGQVGSRSGSILSLGHSRDASLRWTLFFTTRRTRHPPGDLTRLEGFSRWMNWQSMTVEAIIHATLGQSISSCNSCGEWRGRFNSPIVIKSATFSSFHTKTSTKHEYAAWIPVCWRFLSLCVSRSWAWRVGLTTVGMGERPPSKVWPRLCPSEDCSSVSDSPTSTLPHPLWGALH